LSADRRTSGVLCALLSAAAICGGCGRQGAPHDLSATVASDARPANVALTTGGVATPADVSNLGVTAAAAAASCLPTHDGYLRLRMRGASNMDIDWRDADMLCDGGPRPGQQGIRVTFAGPGRRGEHSLRFVFAIAAAPGVRAAHNVPTNVTVIFEGESKLYSTAGDGKCTIDAFSEQRLPGKVNAHLHRITARGFCTAPATVVAGRSGVLLSRFDFAGRVLDEDDADEP
jgi:hypothetical protein